MEGASTEPECTWLAEPTAFFPDCLGCGRTLTQACPQHLGARWDTGGWLPSEMLDPGGWVAGVKLLEFGNPFFPLAAPGQ